MSVVGQSQVCRICTKESGLYRVRETIWKALFPPALRHVPVCIQCLDDACMRRLKRGLTIHDFQDVRINDVLLFAYMMRTASSEPRADPPPMEEDESPRSLEAVPPEHRNHRWVDTEVVGAANGRKWRLYICTNPGCAITIKRAEPREILAWATREGRAPRWVDGAPPRCGAPLT